MITQKHKNMIDKVLKEIDYNELFIIAERVQTEIIKQTKIREQPVRKHINQMIEEVIN